MSAIVGVLAIFALVFVNGFFVAAEFSLVGARRTRVAQIAGRGHSGAQIAGRAIDHLDSYIAATQLGITLASLGLGWIGEPALARVLEPAFELFVPEEAMSTVGHTVSIAIAFSIVTLLHIVLGELAPKSIALQRPEGTAVIVARPVTWFLVIFRPVIFVMNAVGNGVVRLMGFESAGGHERVHSPEELEMLVRSSQEAGLLMSSEGRIMEQAVDFGSIHIKEVMQPRVEVDGIPLEAPLKEVLQQVAHGHHSRYPVYRESSLDQVVGVLHTKDLLALLARQPDLLHGQGTFDLASILRQPLFFPEQASVARVLEEMQRTRTHVTLVLDEFGGMSGIATMEDILEELVGEVQDEFDLDPAPIRSDEKGVVMEGLVSLTDAIERFGGPEGEFGSDTIGGYVAEKLGRIPAKGDKVRFGSYDLYVEKMDEMRVAEVRFTSRAKPRPNSETPASNETL